MGPKNSTHHGQLALREKIHHASFIVAISQFTRSQLYRWAASDDWHKIHVIHCGLDEMFLSAAATPGPGAAAAGQRGTAVRAEGPASADRGGGASPRTRPSNSSWSLWVTVRCALSSNGQIDERGVRSQVRITGFLDNQAVRRELEAARALVMPSFAEGLPVVIMEALALGRPVISTHIAGIPELVEPGSSGWLVPAGDVEPLVAAMAAALTADAALLTAMGRRVQPAPPSGTTWTPRPRNLPT